MDEDVVCLAAAAAQLTSLFLVIHHNDETSKKRIKRRWWTRPWLLRREEQGVYQNLMKELAISDPFAYRNFVRMDPDTFFELLHLIEPAISKKSTQLRTSVSAGERLAVTLRWLATGSSFVDLQYMYRISSQLIGQIVLECCLAIFNSLKGEYLKVPSSNEEWSAIEEGFRQRWNFPNCIGALDGKHIVVQKPNKTGSWYFNYKKNFSIVLLALVDHDYRFTYINVGSSGRISDGGIFNNSLLNAQLEDKSLGIPPDKSLRRDESPLPHVILADDAFPLRPYLMKPYGNRGLSHDERIFNYRLSRARRISENAFGIFSSVFRIFRRPILLNPRKTTIITKAACALHNFLRTKSRSVYIPNDMVDQENLETGETNNGRWRLDSDILMRPISRQGSNFSSSDARKVRDIFKDYFVSPDGRVSWQEDRI